MALVLLVSLLLVLNRAGTASTTCPKFHEWPGSSYANGELVCAHIFEGYRTCSEEGHLVALTQSQQFTATKPTTGVDDGLTFLIRPGCKVLGWAVGSRWNALVEDIEYKSVPAYPEGWNYTCECFVR